jgi:hypothetical protein
MKTAVPPSPALTRLDAGPRRFGSGRLVRHVGHRQLDHIAVGKVDADAHHGAARPALQRSSAHSRINSINSSVGTAFPGRWSTAPSHARGRRAATCRGAKPLPRNRNRKWPAACTRPACGTPSSRASGNHRRGTSSAAPPIGPRPTPSGRYGAGSRGGSLACVERFPGLERGTGFRFQSAA